MMVPAGLVLFLFLVAFVLAALSYYKLDPERPVFSRPFLFMLAPLLLLVVYLTMSALGTLSAIGSGGFLLAALAVLGLSSAQARCLLPKGR